MNYDDFYNYINSGDIIAFDNGVTRFVTKDAMKGDDGVIRSVPGNILLINGSYSINFPKFNEMKELDRGEYYIDTEGWSAFNIYKMSVMEG